MTHRRVNHALTVAVVVLALYILLAPLLPNIGYWWDGRHPTAPPAYVVAATAGKPVVPATTPVPSGNRIVIPKINSDSLIYQGATDEVLNQGPWLRPKTPAPGTGGNTVIAGHRFSYKPGVVQPFYHLDKLELGDNIIIVWDGKVIAYKVTQKKVVPPTQTSIEAPTSQEQLTLYTCTTVWNPVNRLVIVATPVELMQ